MKIKKIELRNSPFFGNKEFVFENSSGKTYDNIVLAGENGSGKTQLLNIIYDFCNLSLSGKVDNEIRIFTVKFSQDEMNYIQNNIRESLKLSNPNGIFFVIQDFSVQSNTWNRIKIKYESIDVDGGLKEIELNSSWFCNDIDRYFLFRSIFSSVEINYDPGKASSVTAKEVDEEIKKSLRSSNNLATEIQQLLIDIQSNDANDLLMWVNEHPAEIPPEDIKNVRIKRFKSAFSNVFDNLNFFKIINEVSNKKVIFKKDDHEIDIGSLSSGEKQIVFRGAFLLQNQGSSKDCCILIDEPEISMHPIWQTKIFDYYRNLFIGESGNQTSQIFMATHSQYVLKSALDDSLNTMILLLKNCNSGVEISHISAPLVLPVITSAEINYHAFNILSNDYHIELYGYLQNKVARLNGNVECSVKECDTFITQQKDYDVTRHFKPSLHRSRNGHVTTYDALPAFIRNAIDHPSTPRTFTTEELRTSIELLMRLCR